MHTCNLAHNAGTTGRESSKAKARNATYLGGGLDSISFPVASRMKLQNYAMVHSRYPEREWPMFMKEVFCVNNVGNKVQQQAQRIRE